MTPSDPVAFPEGTHVYTSGLGTVTVHVPRPVTASDIAPAVRRFIERSDDFGEAHIPAPDAAKAAA
ncbi:hypothetical protein [Adlercreutzia muris]|uniref:Uncharacterized protein n=1 Tax=Adlercreutzia muris TaxID=1796610 RepID=A0A7C8BRG6_9ACTN|nr:hypothetical protein [Adlercreutzia muris]KAB1647967.1 hypothetical protein F8D48_06655 [Adlercreutzia muris]MCR2027743.1 hypothetical protein [Adlercreutzia muris]